MAIFSKSSFAPSTAVIYITVGALMTVWTAVYFFSFMNEGSPEARQTAFFWITGFFLTGITLMVIGFALGPIGRSAQQAVPVVATPPVVQPEVVATPVVADLPVVNPAVAQPVAENQRAQV